MKLCRFCDIISITTPKGGNNMLRISNFDDILVEYETFLEDSRRLTKEAEKAEEAGEIKLAKEKRLLAATAKTNAYRCYEVLAILKPL